MKSVFVTALFVAAAAAQRAFIGAPPANSTFSPGEQIVVEVTKPVCLPCLFQNAYARG